VVAHITELQHVVSSQRFIVCNVHLLYGFTQYLEKMRNLSVKYIRRVLCRVEYNALPQLICGDFNSKSRSTPLKEIARGKKFFDIYHSVVKKDPEMTVEPYQHGEPIAVDYMFATTHFIPTKILQMPTIASMRRKQLPIPGYEASDHLYHLSHLSFS
jgi:endonuclease/exonuclease/phosphatase family metal-dependent hydrolase